MAAQGDDEPRGIPGRRTARRLQRRGALQPHRIPGVRMLLPQRPYQLAHLLKDAALLPLDLRGIDGALRRARLLPRCPPAARPSAWSSRRFFFGREHSIKRAPRVQKMAIMNTSFRIVLTPISSTQLDFSGAVGVYTWISMVSPSARLPTLLNLPV